MKPAGPAAAPAAACLPPWLDPVLRTLLGAQAPAALLLAGPAGIGKSALAGAYAKALLCEARAPGQPACGACDACGWFEQGAHPDLRRIVPEADAREAAEPDAGASGSEAGASTTQSGAAPRASRAIRIAPIQRLSEFFAVGGHRSARRVVWIDPADALNAPAANALLKTLEEPPAGAAFVLCSARPALLPATVRSRCRRLALRLPPAPESIAWLAARTGMQAPAAQELLAAAGGAPLAALGLADSAQAAARRAMLDTVARLPDSGWAEAADALAGADPAELIGLLQRWLADIARVGAGAAPRFAATRAARLAELARRGSLGARAQAAEQLARQRALASHPLNARLFVEQTLQGYLCAFDGQRATGHAR